MNKGKEHSNLVANTDQTDLVTKRDKHGIDISQDHVNNNSRTSTFTKSTKANIMLNEEIPCENFKHSLSSSNDQKSCSTRIDEQDINSAVTTIFDDDFDIQNPWPTVQGNFNQGNDLFGTTAGLQCVPNCLSALSYHNLKSSHLWNAADMDKILMTGNELYENLQRYTNIAHHYMFISDLPDALEIHNEMFSFDFHEPISTLIQSKFDDNMPDLSLFNVKSLKEALQTCLNETDGCFVCFSENTMIVGKVRGSYFLFDSHSRSVTGKLMPEGKSTCIFVNNLSGVYKHIIYLAHSMEITSAIQCEITGLTCNCTSYNVSLNSVPTDRAETVHTEDDIAITFVEKPKDTQFEHVPLNIRKHLCENLQIPFIADNIPQAVSIAAAGEPLRCQGISGDGNCFFRAVSFYLSGSDHAHDRMRLEMCKHIMQNQAMFQKLLRSNQCFQSYVKDMGTFGSWATEVEVIAMSHMLNIPIFTYEDSQWSKYSGKLIDKTWSSLDGAIYLNHVNRNHYDVVVSVFNKNPAGNHCAVNTETKASSSTSRTLETAMQTDRIDRERKRKKDWYNKRYETCMSFRKHVLATKKKHNAKDKVKKKMSEKHRNCYENVRQRSLEYAKAKYKTDEKYRDKILLSSSNKYKRDARYKRNLIQFGKEKYKRNAGYRKELLDKGKTKYRNDQKYRDYLKQCSKKKYDEDDRHRALVRQKGVQKYKTFFFFREAVIEKSKTRYESSTFKDNLKEKN